MLAAVLIANASMTLPVASMALPAYPLAFFLSFGHVQNNCKPEQLERLSQKFR
jgi:hypothetical protein